MPSIDSGVLAAIVIAIGGVVTQQLIRRGNREGVRVTAALEEAKTELEERRVGLDEFNAHKEFMRGQISELRVELDEERRARLVAETASRHDRDTAEAAERRAFAAERQAIDCQHRADEQAQQLARAEARIGQLEAWIRDQSGHIPPVT